MQSKALVTLAGTGIMLIIGVHPLLAFSRPFHSASICYSYGDYELK